MVHGDEESYHHDSDRYYERTKARMDVSTSLRIGGIMSTYKEYSSSSGASDDDINEALNHYKEYITLLVWKYVPRNVVPGDILDMVVHDIAQDVLIKFWMAMERQRIIDTKAYLRRMVYHEVINMIRASKPLLPLLLDSENEVRSGRVLVNASQGMGDPLDELERKETEKEFVTQTVAAAQKLPPCQRRALFCELKDRLDDLTLLMDALSRYGLDISAFDWPEEKQDLPTLRSSLSVSRKKLRARLDRLLE